MAARKPQAIKQVADNRTQRLFLKDSAGIRMVANSPISPSQPKPKPKSFEKPADSPMIEK